MSNSRRELFEFMKEQVGRVKRETGLADFQAFTKWFINLYFHKPRDVFVSDGTGDGRVDAFFKTDDGENLRHHILNAKYTTQFDKIAPVAFYSEILSFIGPFRNKGMREQYLSNTVRQELRPHYKKLFKAYDLGNAELMFVTNCRENTRQCSHIEENEEIEVFHLSDILQYMYDDIEGAMPRTPQLTLTGIGHVLSPDEGDTAVPTAIVFARLVDFITYMEKDRYHLLFARNVRLSLGNTPVNKDIRYTFANEPTEFAFSNNGITLLCEDYVHKGSKDLCIINPRVLNGAQTLHSVRDVPQPSPKARVMVRIIKVTPPRADEFTREAKKRKEIVGKISLRTNLQNPIKRWNLVSNDDYQHDLARFFRSKSLFYERRTKEWSVRKTELRSIGVSRGPSIKILTQLIASFDWKAESLGPAMAKGSVARLFEEKAYQEVKRTPHARAYQLYLLRDVIKKSYASLQEKEMALYLESFKGHVRFALFALVVRALEAACFKWDLPELTAFLKNGSDCRTTWDGLVLLAMRFIKSHYDRANKVLKKEENKELTLNNFFKSRRYVDKIFEGSLPMNLLRTARKLRRLSRRLR